jgi:hypothetical protein
VTEAQAARAPSERFSEWFGQRYTIAVLAARSLAFFGLLRLGHTHASALYRAATLLVAASPCAIVISVPAAILSALSAAARGGVLFKGGAALETAGRGEILCLRQDRHADHGPRRGDRGGRAGRRPKMACCAGRRAGGAVRTPDRRRDPPRGRGTRA